MPRVHGRALSAGGDTGRAARRRQRRIALPAGPDALVFDPLELRVLLNADILSVQLAAMPAEANDHAVIVRMIEESVRIGAHAQTLQAVEVVDQHNPNLVLAIGNLAQIGTVAIRGAGIRGAESVLIDADSFGANTLPVIEFTGGRGPNALVVEDHAGTPLTWQINGAGSGGISGDVSVRFTNVATLVAIGGDNTLDGPAMPTTWNITGLNAGTVAGTTFSGFDHLQGAADNASTFVFSGNGDITNGVGGGAGGYNTVQVDSGSYQQEVLAATNSADGSIVLDGATIAYTGMSPIDIQAGAVDVTIDINSVENMANNVTLSGSGGTLTLSDPGGAETQHFADPTGQLTIALNASVTNNVTIDSLGNFAAGLEVDNTIGVGGVEVAGSIATGGGAFTIDEATTIVPNTEAPGTSFLLDNTGTINTASASGPAGAINIAATTITLSPGSVLDADASTTAYADGTITLDAADTSYRQVPSPLLFVAKQVDLTAKGATIEGGDVFLQAIAYDASLPNDIPTQINSGNTNAVGIADSLNQIVTSIPATAIAQLSPIGLSVIVRGSDANLTLDGATIDSTGSVEVSSSVEADTFVFAIASKAQAGIGNTSVDTPADGAIGFARTTGTVTTSLIDGTSITAAGDVGIYANGTITAISTAQASDNFTQGSIDPTAQSYAVAIADSQLTSTVSISADTMVTAVAGSVNADATGSIEAAGISQTTGPVDATAGFAIGLSYSSSTITSTVNGTITAGGDSGPAAGAFNAGSSSVVDTINDSFNLPTNNLHTGELVVYNAGTVDTGGTITGGMPIGGLVSGDTYYVIVTGPGTFELAAAPVLALDPSETSPVSRQTLAPTAGVEFELDAVDTSNNSIFLPGHSFATGDTVVYTFGTDATAIGGLTNGAAYTVNVLDASDFQLENAGTVVTLSDPAGSGVGLQIFTGTTQIALAAFASIDGNANTIDLPDNGLPDGQLVHYDAENDGASDPVLGLQSAGTYTVQTLTADTFELIDPAAGTVVAIGDPGTASVQALLYNGDAETFTPAPLTIGFDAVDPVDNKIALNTSGLAAGDVVTYGTLAGATAIGGLVSGGTYTIGTLDADSLSLLNNAMGTVQVEPGSASGTQYFIDGSKTIYFALGSLDITSGTFYSAGDGLSTGETVTYAGTLAGVASVLSGLTSGAQYTVKVVSPDAFELVDPATNAIVTPGSYSVGSFNLTPNVVNPLDDSIFLPGNTFVTGEAVVYDVDPAITSSATTTSVAQNGSVTVVPLTVQDQAIGGLVSGASYYVVVVDASHIRLTDSYIAALDAVPITLSSLGSGADQTISPDLDAVNGIGVMATLTGEVEGESSPSVGGTTSPDTAFQGVLALQPDVTIGTFLGNLGPTSALSTGNASSMVTDNAGNTVSTSDPISNNSLSASGAFSVNVDLATARATVGTDTGADAARLTTPGTIDINGTVSSENEGEATAATTKPKNAGGTAVSLALAVQVMTTDAEATIGSNAVVNAGGPLRVTSTVVYPFLETPTDLIPIYGEFPSEGLYSALQFFDGNFGLSDDLNTWVAAVAQAPVDPKDGLPAQPSPAYSGAVSVAYYNNTSDATIASGAQVNQDALLQTPDQAVDVQATTTIDLLQLGGQMKFSLNESPFISGSGLQAPTAVNNFVDAFGRSGSTAIGGALLVTAIVDQTEALIDPNALVHVGDDPDSGLTVTSNESVLNIEAAEAGGSVTGSDTTAFAGSGIGNGQNSTTLAGLVADGTGGPTITGGGTVTIAATTGGNAIALAGALVSSDGGNSGVGVSLVINAIIRQTDAFIGLNPTTGTVAPTGTVTLDAGTVSLTATTTGGIAAATIAGVLASGDSSAAPATQSAGGGAPTQTAPTAGASAPANLNDQSDTSSAVGVAGAGVGEGVNDTTLASIDAPGTADITGLTQTATDKGLVFGLAGAASLQLGAGQDEESKTIAGAIDVNVVIADTAADLQGLDVNTTDPTNAASGDHAVSLSALQQGTLVSLAVAAAAETSAEMSPGESQSFAGSLAINYVTSTTQALVEAAATIAAGTMSLSATEGADVVVIGGGVSYSDGDLGLGASLAFNLIQANTTAGIVGGAGGRPDVDLAGNLSAVAINTDDITAIAVSAGATSSEGGTAAAFTLAINIIAPDTSAFTHANADALTATITDADVKADGTVTLTAQDNSNVVSVAGAFAVAADSDAFGVGASWNQIALQIGATIDDATVAGDGGVSLLADSTATTAPLDGKIVAAAVSGAGASGTAVGAAVSVDGVLNTIDAGIKGGSTVNADAGTISITAMDTSIIRTLVGGLAISIGGNGAGAAIGADYVDNLVTAEIDGSTVSGQAIAINADEDADIGALTLGLAGAAENALGGSVSIDVISDTVNADINGASRVNATGTIDVAAVNDARITATAGALAIAFGGVGVGASVTTVVVVNNNNAFVAGDAVVAGVGGVAITANTTQTIANSAIGGAVAADAAVAGSLPVTGLSDTTQAYIGAPDSNALAGAEVQAGTGTGTTGNVLIAATSVLTLIGTAGALAASSGVGVGIGAAAGGANRKTDAFVGQGATVTADGSVLIEADANEEVVANSIAGSGGATAGIGLTAGISSMVLTTTATIGNAAVVFARGNVVVSAQDDSTSYQLSGNVTGGGDVAVGVAAGISTLNKTTQATIDPGAQVTALALGPAVQTNIAGFTTVDASDAEQKQPQVTFDASAVGQGGTIDAPANGLQTGEQVIYGAAGEALGGLDDGSVYYVISLDADHIELAQTYADSKAGVAIPVTLGMAQPTDTQSLNPISGGGVPAISATSLDTTGISAYTIGPEATAARTGVIVVAASTNLMENSAFAVAGSGGVAVPIGGAVAVDTIDTDAAIQAGAAIDPNQTGAAGAQDVYVDAARSYRAISVGLGGGVGATAAIAPGVAVPVLEGNTEALISGPSSGTPTTVAALGNIEVAAVATESFVAVAVGVAGAGVAAVGGSVAVVAMDTTTTADISGIAVVKAGGNVLVAATDATSDYAIAGAAGVAIGGGAGAGAFAVTQLDKTTDALIEAGATVDASADSTAVIPDIPTGAPAVSGVFPTAPVQGVAVAATSSETVTDGAGSGAGGLYAGLAGAVTVEIITANTLAAIRSGAQVNANVAGFGNTQPGVSVTAVDTVNEVAVAGALGVGGIAGVGAGVDVAILRNDTQAVIDGAAVAAAGATNVLALTVRNLSSTPVAAGAALGLGLGGGIAVLSIGGDFSLNYSATDASGNTDTSNPLAGNGSDVLSQVNSGIGTLLQALTQPNGGSLPPIDPSMAVADKTIDFGTATGLSTGEAVTFSASGYSSGETTGGLTVGNTYFVIVTDPDHIQLAMSYDDAVAGNAVQISPATGTWTFTPVTGTALGNQATAEDGAALPDNAVAAAEGSTATDSGTTAAIENGAGIQTASLTVIGSQTYDVEVHAGAAALGAIGALGVGIAVVSATADVSAYIAPDVSVTALGTPGAVTVAASNDGLLHVLGFAGSLGGLIGLGAAVASVTDASNVSALIGSSVNSGTLTEGTSASPTVIAGGFTGVTVQAEAAPKIELSTGAAAASLGTGAGASITTATIGGNVVAEIGNAATIAGTTAAALGALDVAAERSAVIGPFDSGKPEGIGLSGGLVSGTAGVVDETVAGNVQADVGTGAVIAIGGGATISANGTTNANLKVDGGALGFAALGAMVGALDISGAVSATVGAAGSLRAQSISITANGTNTAYAIAYPAGGGVIGATAGGSSSVTLTPSALVSLGANAALIATGGDVTLAATSNDRLEADVGTTNFAVGVGLGVLYTQFDYAGTVVAQIGADALVQATGNVAISAISNDIGTSTASGGGGAIIGVQTDQSTGTFDVTTTIEVGAGATVMAGDALTLFAQSTVDAAALTPSLTAGGLGAGANVQGTLTVDDLTLVRLDANVILQAPTVTLSSDIASLTALSMPQGTSDGAIVGADATGNLTVTAMSIVSIAAGDSIAASGAASFIASFEELSAQGIAVAQANGLGGGQAFTSLNVTALTEVYGDPAATVATNQFDATARQPVLPTLGSTQDGSAVGIQVQSSGTQSAMSGGTVDWSSTLIITPAPDSAALTVNALGSIVTQNLISASIAGGTIVVNNVTADPSVPGSVLFDAPSGDVAGAASEGVVTGSPTIEVQTGINAVDITNLSSLDLRLGEIALSPPPSTGAASAVTVANGSTSTFRPDIIGAPSVTTIDVQSAASPLSDVLIGGNIADPDGLVVINAGSNIVAAGGTISADLLALDAGGGAGMAAAPIALGSADLNAAIAGGGLWINAAGTVGIGSIVVAGTADIAAAAINGVVGATGILAAATTLDANEGAIGSAALPVLVSAPGAAAPVAAVASDGIAIQGGTLGLAPQRVIAGTGDVLLRVPDQVGTGQNITVGAASVLRAVSGSVTLQAGDDVTIAAGGSVGAADAVTIDDNFTGAGGSPDTLAGTIDVAGLISAPAVFLDNFNLAGAIALTNTQAGSSTTINTGSVVGGATAVLLGSDATPTSDTFGALHGIAGAVTIDGISHAAAVTLDDTGDPALQVTGTLSGGTLTGLGLDAGASIVINDIGTLQANLGDYAATVDVESIPSATDVVLDLQDTTGGIVDVGTGGHTLSGIAGLLSVQGSGHDRLAIDDSGATVPTLSQLTANALTGLQMGNSTTAAIDGTAGIFFSNLGSVSLSLGAGADHLTITGVSAPTSINTGAGGDTVTVTSLAQLADPLSISATAGSGARFAVAPTGGSDLVVARLNGTTGTLYSASDVAQGLTFSNQSALDITQGSANDSLLIHDSPVPVTAVTTGLQSGITVTAISQALSLTLGGSLEAAQILAAAGNVTVTAAGSADSLDINLANTQLPVAATLTNGASAGAGVFTGLLGGTLDFAGLAKLTVELGSGNDAVTINESIADTAITLNGGGGNNSFTVDQANTSSSPPLLTLLGGTGESTATLVVPGVPTAAEFIGIDFSVGTLTIDDLADTTTPITWAQTDGGLVTAAFNGGTVDVVNATGATTTNVIGGTLASGANTLDVTTDSNDDIQSMLSGNTITLAYGGNVVTTEPLAQLVSAAVGTTFTTAVNGSSSYANGGLTVATTGSFVVHAGNASTPAAISAGSTSDVFTITGTGGLPFSLYSIDLAVPAGKTVPSSLLLHYTTAAGITGTDTLTAVSGLAAGGSFTVEAFAAPLDNLTDLVAVSFTPGVLEIGGIIGLVAQPGSLAAAPVTPASFTLEPVNGQFVFGPDNIATGTLLANPNNGLPDQSITGFLSDFYEEGSVQYTDTIGNGAQTLTLVGNVVIPANETITVTGGGAGAFILQVDGNVTIGAGAVVDVSANGTVAGPGGGFGGDGNTGGAMYESAEYGVAGSDYAAGGTGGPGGTYNGGAGVVGQPGSSVAGFPGVAGSPGFEGSPGYNESPQYAAGGAGGPGGTGGAATVDQFGNNALPVGGAGGPAGSPQTGLGAFNGYDGANGSAGNPGTATPNAGLVGQPGTGGAGGGAAPTDLSTTPFVTGGAGGGGGGGGGSGGGGASGISGSGGGGGASGTYGQFNELDKINSGSGGQGGYGGAGGAGGSGGTGGAGGQGGGGGGAFEIIAEGEITANTGTILAEGGAGAAGTTGSAGYPGAAGQGGLPGSAGDPGASGTNIFFTGTVYGGMGGNGGVGGAGDAGAAGGMGGTGGQGGGGAGGSVALLASVLQVGSLDISLAGGAGATAADNGAAGRVLLAYNTTTTAAPSNNGTSSFYTGVAVSPNPYAGSATIDTPNIPNLLGGPYAYGLLNGVTLTAAELAGHETIPSTSIAAVSLLPADSPLLGSYAQNYSNYDVLVFVNLSGQPLEGPALSVGGGTPQALEYADSTGIYPLTALNPGAVWAELVPTGAVVVNASLAPTSGLSYVTQAATLSNEANANTAFIEAARPSLTSNSTPLSGFAAAVYSPNGQSIYAVDPADSTVVVLSAATGGVEQTITDGVAGYFGLGYPTQGLKGVDYVAVSPDGTVVFTGGPGGVDAFSVDPTTGQLTYFYTFGTTDLAASNPYGFETQPLPGSVNGLTAFTEPVIGGQPIEAAYISTSGGFLQWDYEYGYIPGPASTSSLANVVGQTAGVSDTEVYPSFTVQQQSVIYALSNGGATLDAIVPFSTSFTNGTPIASVALPIAGTAATTSPNGNFIYVASQSGDALSVITQTETVLNDPYVLTLVQTLTNGEDGVHGLAAPSSLAVTPDGRYLLVGSEANSSLAVFSINQSSGALTYLQELRDDVGGADGLADVAGLLAGAPGSTTYALSLGNAASGVGGITPLAIAATPPTPVAYAITFSNIADVELTLSGNGANTITLAQPPTANVTTESITAGNGGNLINLQALAPDTIVNTGTGADTLNIIAVQTGATLTADTGAGNDIINLYSAAANTVFRLSVGDGNDHFYVQGKGIAPNAGVELFADTASPLGDVLIFNPANPNPNTPNFTPTNFSQTSGDLQVIGFGVVKYTAFKQVIVENPPIINAPNVSTKEGQGVVLNATAFAVEGSLVGSLEYDLGNDGVFDVGGGSISAATLADYGINARGTYSVGVEAIDSDGGTAIAHFNIIVGPVNPVVSVTGAATAQVGSIYTIDLGATLQGTDAITGWEVNWGDGTTQTYGAGVADVTHTFEAPGNFNVEAEAADSYSASGQYPYHATKPVTAALPASFTLSQSITISEGQGLTLVVPGDVPGTPIEYQWSINGRSIGGTQTGTTLSQTWAQLQASDGVTQAGTYTVGLSPGYPGRPPGASLGTTSLVVLNTPPAVVVTPGSAVQIGSNATFTLAVTSAASAVQAAGYKVELDVAYPGGLTAFVGGTLAAGGVVTVPAVLIPRAVGGYEVLGTVSDSEGGTTSFTDDFNVVAAPGTVVLNGSSFSTEGQTYDLSVGVTGGNTISGYLVNWGDGVTQTLQGGNTQTAAHVFLVNGSLAVDVTAIDSNATYTAVQDVTVANVAPTLSLSGPASVPQGSPLVLAGTITDPGPDDQFSLLINWDDGTPSTQIQLAPGVTAFATPHSYADVAAGGSYTITATVTDDNGATGTATLAETVTNVAPSITAIGFTSPTINEGGTATLAGLFADPGTLDSHTALINWGDGATSIGTVDTADDTFSAAHVYANNPSGQPDGSFVATATITDDHGASDIAAAAETVQNVAPIITGVTITPVAVVQGSAIAVTATFTDPGTLDTHTAVIDWGDGDTTQATVAENNGSGSIIAAHTFDGAAPPAGQSFYSVTATVTDSDGGSTSQVLDPPPTAQNLVVSAPTINEGGAVTLRGTIVDVAPIGGADTVDILWGDGNITQAAISLATPTFDVTHTYLDNPPGEPDGGYRIQVVAANAIGNTSTAATGVQVDNVAPRVDNLKLNTSHIDEGSAVTLTGTVADAGALDRETLSIAWGDGGTTAATVNLATRAFSATHTYLDNPPDEPDGSYTIVVTATDNAGAQGSASTSVEVDNVAPHIDRLGTNAGTVAAGSAVSLTGTVIDPGVLDSETVSVNWGDGTTSAASINRTTRVLSATHVYAAGSAVADADYTITATAIDNSGGSGSAQIVVQVDTPPAAQTLRAAAVLAAAPLATAAPAATLSNAGSADPAPVVAVAMAPAQPAQLITLLQSSPITVPPSDAAGGTGAVLSLVFDEDDGSFNAAQNATAGSFVATSLVDDYGEDWLLVGADPDRNSSTDQRSSLF